MEFATVKAQNLHFEGKRHVLHKKRACHLTKLLQSSIITLHFSAGAAFQSNLVLFAYNAGVVELVDTLA
ncbi:MAG: hypothetical protein II932_07205 [Treponema sp.]|nr:hypothetical protein [Treponema sp.]